MIIVNFTGEETCKNAHGLWQWDYGQVLRIQGLKLPKASEIHFSMQETGGDAVTRVGVSRDGVVDVVIPDSMLENGGASRDYRIFVFVYLANDDSGETIRKIALHVRARPRPEAFERPEDTELFREAIEAVNEVASRAEIAADMAEGWAHGREDMTERAQDNAMYYAGKAQEFSESAADSLAEMQRLAEETDANVKQAAQDKSDTAEYMNAAAQSETNAVASALAAQTAQEAAETAQKSAGNAASIAESAAGRAELAKDNAARAAINASASADSASLSARNAENSAEEAAQSAADALALKNSAANEIEQDKTDSLTQIEAEKTAAIKSVNDSGSIWTAAVNTAGEAQVSAVNLAGQAQVEAVEQEGTEQVAMIQATAGEYITYESAEALAIKSHAEGSAILARDSAVWRMPGMRIYGKSTQKTTTGAQLANWRNFNYESSSVTAVGDENGVVTISGEPTSLVTIYGPDIDISLLEVGVRYSAYNDSSIVWYLDDGSVAYGARQFAEDIVRAVPYIQRTLEGFVDGEVVYTMIKRTDCAVEWEPYTGGIPSPNIDYPQNIVSLAQDAGAVEVSVGGGNLISDDKIYRTETNLYVGYVAYGNEGILLKRGITYTLSANYVVSGLYFKKRETDKDIIHVYSSKTLSYTPEEDIEASFDCFVNSGLPSDITLALNIGAEAIPYEPFKTAQTASFLCPNGLPGLNISVNPNVEEGLYTDDEGKLYVADYVNFETGEYVKCINIVKISSFISLVAYGNGNYKRLLYRISGADLGIDIDRGSKCTHFKMHYSFNTETEHFYVTSGNIYLFTEKFSTLEEANAWLQENEVYVAYVLKTPIRTPLTEQEIAAYKALRTYSPSTTITNDAGAHMEADYITDPETYISNNYTPKSAYDTLEQRVLALETNLIGG